MLPLAGIAGAAALGILSHAYPDGYDPERRPRRIRRRADSDDRAFQKRIAKRRAKKGYR